MADSCLASIANGEVRLSENKIDWDTDSSTFQLLNSFADRILFTSKVVCEKLRFHLFSQTVWVNDRPKTVSVFVESIDSDRARITVDQIAEMNLDTLFGSVPLRAFEQSNEVYLLSDANPSLSPGPKVIYVNQAFEKMTGYGKHEIIGKTPRILHGEKTDPTKRQFIRDSLSKWNPIQIEMHNYRKDGTEFEVELNITPIADSLGWNVFWFAIQRNVTDKNQQLARQTALARAEGIAEGAKDALHNIGNVLNSLSLTTAQLQRKTDGSFIHTLRKLNELVEQNKNNFVEFVKTDARGSKLPHLISALTASAEDQHVEIQSALADITTNAKHITAVISDQRTGLKSRGQTERVSVRDVMADSLSACKAYFNKTMIEVTNQVDDQLPMLQVNKHRVIQILANLLKNASEALHESAVTTPRISFSATRVNDQIEFAVSDNGIGISADKIDQIFSRGFTTKNSGNGFGLHSSFAIAKALGGELSVSSGGFNQGATFELRLPIPSPDLDDLPNGSIDQKNQSYSAQTRV